MQYNSFIFILLFLPTTIVGYYLLNRIHMMAGKYFLSLASFCFYAYAGWEVAAVLVLSVLFNYCFSILIRRSQKHGRAMLAISITGNVALLFYIKYIDFVVKNINLLFEMEYHIQSIIISLGVSFFTFQQIAYQVNVYRGEIDKVCLSDYVTYILYFPKLLMGPLAEPVDFISQLNDDKLKRVNWDNLSFGIKLFSFGLFKKLLLADTFSNAVSWGYANFDVATSMDWILVMLFYTFEIYFDFSGYSDMAMGVSMMLNINLPMNFDSPYKALSIRDFWKRWHMSLTGFLTKYVYIPLGGSKKGTIRTYLNTMIVFLISGIWHGANWTFILWGVLHGALSVFDRVFEKGQKRLLETVRWGTTFLTVNILWLLFRSDSIMQWWKILGKICSFQNTAVSDGLLAAFILPESSFMIELFHLGTVNTSVRGLWLLLFMIGAYVICLIPENNYRKKSHNSYLTMVLAAAAFVWSFLCLSSESVFVYFNF